MPRLHLLHLPNTLRRRVRRNRLAMQLLLLSLLLFLVVLPLYSIYCVYKPPRYLVGYLRAKYPDVLFEVDVGKLKESGGGGGGGKGGEKLIALSLDDAPSKYTEDIMRVLSENDAHATFFIIGSQVPSRETTLQRLISQGHELANHAMHDEPSTSLSNADLESQLNQVKSYLTTAYESQGLILPNNYFRPGSGFFHRRMRDFLGNRGFRIVLGSVYPFDAQIPYPGINARHILSMAHPGAIIICHDRRGARTIELLRLVLPELKRRGYKIVTITDLVKSVEPLGGR